MATTTPTGETYERLIALDQQLEASGIKNKHDRVTMLIVECITEGIDSGSLIVHVLSKLKFDRKHVGKLLSEGPDSVPPEHQWFKGADGRLKLS